MKNPTTPSNDKSFDIGQIKSYVPISLDMVKLNYEVWRELFETHCSCFGVLGHLDGTSPLSSASDKSWKEHDDLVKMWIYGTISESILETVLKPKCTARDLWLAIETLFHENKEVRAMQLENELHTTVIDDLSVHENFKKLKKIVDLLENVDSPISERVLVMHILNGLSDKFNNIINVINHKTPFSGFIDARSMLQMEEDHLSNHVKPIYGNNHSPSSSTLLYSTSDNPLNENNHDNNNKTNHNSRNNQVNDNGSGHGENYRHNRCWGHGGQNNRGIGRFNNWSSNYTNNIWPTTFGYPQWPPMSYSSIPPSYLSYICNGSSMGSSLPHLDHSSMKTPSLFGPPTFRPTHEAHFAHGLASPTPKNPQAMLPASTTHAFNSMVLQDPNDAQWYMDNGATNDIASHAGNMYSIFSSSNLPTITVGNGSSVTVMTLGQGSSYSD